MQCSKYVVFYSLSYMLTAFYDYEMFSLHYQVATWVKICDMSDSTFLRSTRNLFLHIHYVSQACVIFIDGAESLTAMSRSQVDYFKITNTDTPLSDCKGAVCKI